MPPVLRDWLEAVVGLVYPPLCPVCLAPLADARSPFCEPCGRGLLARPDHVCLRCAARVGPHVETANGCPACRGVSFAFERVFSMGLYEEPLRSVILRIKHGGQEGLAESLGGSWARRDRDALRATGVEVVVPVPLHWARRFWRGGNQAEALARGLARGLDLPLRAHAIVRTRATPKQTSVTRSARVDNVRGAFRAVADPALIGRIVLLVDDVLTTGTTASEAARALRAGGAARVLVAAAARSTT